MVAASILPVAIHKGKLYFLFGKENEMEDSARGFSDFGGGVEEGESIMDTALREGSEELCGFLGDYHNIEKILKNGFYPLVHEKYQYHVHIFYMEYDEKLPCYFTNNHRFLWERMDKNILNDSKYFEKQEIRWFSIEDMYRSKKEFRKFYIEIVDLLLENTKKITSFVKKVSKERRGALCTLSKTQKKRGG